MTHGSLFTGIGGIDLGFERAGIETLWQVERNPYCVKVLEKHWPDVIKFSEVGEVGRHNLATVDIISGGFPCQPFSFAGKRRGETDDRHLWPQMLRIIKEVQPRWVVAENVPGIIPIFLDQVFLDLEAQGYEVWPVVLPACAVDAPHRRDRLFILAHARQQPARNAQLGRDAEASDQSSRRGEVVTQAVADTKRFSQRHSQRRGSAIRRTKPTCGNLPWRWATEPHVGRVAHGIPARVDRLKCLGNAVVPAVAQFIGEMIVNVESSYKNSPPMA